MSEGKRYQYALSFAHCVRANNFWSGNRDVQSAWSVLTPCHMTSLWTGCWGSVSEAHRFTLGLWTGMFADRAVPVWWKNVCTRICEAQDRPEPRSLSGCDMVYVCDQTEGARSVASLWSIILSVCLAANTLFLHF